MNLRFDPLIDLSGMKKKVFVEIEFSYNKLWKL